MIVIGTKKIKNKYLIVVIIYNFYTKHIKNTEI